MRGHLIERIQSRLRIALLYKLFCLIQQGRDWRRSVRPGSITCVLRLRPGGNQELRSKGHAGEEDADPQSRQKIAAVSGTDHWGYFTTNGSCFLPLAA